MRTDIRPDSLGPLRDDLPLSHADSIVWRLRIGSALEGGRFGANAVLAHVPGHRVYLMIRTV